jgi:hypothetical protein
MYTAVEPIKYNRSIKYNWIVPPFFLCPNSRSGHGKFFFDDIEYNGATPDTFSTAVLVGILY